MSNKITKELLDLITQNKKNKVEVTRGCNAIGGCFCTGKCNDVIGYWEDGKYTQIEPNESVLIITYQNKLDNENSKVKLKLDSDIPQKLITSLNTHKKEHWEEGEFDFNKLEDISIYVIESGEDGKTTIDSFREYANKKVFLKVDGFLIEVPMQVWVNNMSIESFEWTKEIFIKEDKN